MLSILTALTSMGLLAAPPGPFGNARHPVTREAWTRPTVGHSTPPLSSSFLGTAHGVYRDILSPVDGPRCAHRPTCSRYAWQALAQHGWLGIWLTYDRLLRDARSSSVRLLPVRLEEGRLVYLDPLTESTFWLH
jgi:membrane protein insertion efficiency factor YidD